MKVGPLLYCLRYARLLRPRRQAGQQLCSELHVQTFCQVPRLWLRPVEVSRMVMLNHPVPLNWRSFRVKNLGTHNLCSLLIKDVPPGYATVR